MLEEEDIKKITRLVDVVFHKINNDYDGCHLVYDINYYP